MPCVYSFNDTLTIIILNSNKESVVINLHLIKQLILMAWLLCTVLASMWLIQMQWRNQCSSAFVIEVDETRGDCVSKDSLSKLNVLSFH